MGRRDDSVVGGLAEEDSVVDVVDMVADEDTMDKVAGGGNLLELDVEMGSKTAGVEKGGLRINERQQNQPNSHSLRRQDQLPHQRNGLRNVEAPITPRNSTDNDHSTATTPSQYPVIHVVPSPDVDIGIDFKLHRWVGSEMDTDKARIAAQGFLKEPQLSEGFPQNFGIVQIAMVDTSSPSARVSGDSQDAAGAEVVEAIATAPTILLSVPKPAIAQFEYLMKLLTYKGSWWWYSSQDKSGFDAHTGHAYVHQSQNAGPMMAPNPPSWLRDGSTFAKLQPLVRFQDKQQYEMIHKLGLMWEAQAAEIDAAQTIDKTARQIVYVDEFQAFGPARTYAFTVRNMVRGNPMGKLKVNEELKMWFSDNPNDFELGRVTREMIKGKFSFSFRSDRHFSKGEPIQCRLAINVDHLPTRREMQAVTKAVALRSNPRWFDIKDIVPGPSQRKLVRIRDWVDEEDWYQTQEAVNRAFYQNEEQREAFDQIMDEGLPNGVSIVQGSPGTGKSTLITATTKALASMRQRVLLCADSNAAVDSVLRYIVDPDPVHHELRIRAGGIVRANTKTRVMAQLRKGAAIIGNANDFQEEIEEYASDDVLQPYLMVNWILDSISRYRDTDEDWVKIEVAIKEAQRTPSAFPPRNTVDFRNAVELAMEKVLASDEVRIVASTLNNSVTLEAFKEDAQVHDESAASKEAGTLCALTREPKLVVLVGDHKQLPPTVLSSTHKNNPYRAQMEMSLFQRLIENGWGKTTLRRQYRMHPDISKGPNARDYDGQLIDDESVKVRTAYSIFWEQFAAQHHSMHGKKCRRLVIDVDSPSVRPTGSFSFQNETIAGIVTELVTDLMHFESTGDDGMLLNPQDVAVITPYLAEKYLVATNFRRTGDRDVCRVVTSSVDGFQGQQARFIIKDLTGPHLNLRDPEKIGFIGDEKRMNVALTRARDALVIVGDFSRWQAHLPALRRGGMASKKFAAFVQEILDDGAVVKWQPNTFAPSLDGLPAELEHNVRGGLDLSGNEDDTPAEQGQLGGHNFTSGLDMGDDKDEGEYEGEGEDDIVSGASETNYNAADEGRALSMVASPRSDIGGFEDGRKRFGDKRGLEDEERR
ncbi:hypothetical protein MMC30_000036 [Trapelia coarctata]|nr:hypothetical protein [Trapelia coarctata]